MGGTDRSSPSHRLPSYRTCPEVPRPVPVVFPSGPSSFSWPQCGPRVSHDPCHPGRAGSLSRDDRRVLVTSLRRRLHRVRSGCAGPRRPHPAVHRRPGTPLPGDMARRTVHRIDRCRRHRCSRTRRGRRGRARPGHDRPGPGRREHAGRHPDRHAPGPGRARVRPRPRLRRIGRRHQRCRVRRRPDPGGRRAHGPDLVGAPPGGRLPTGSAARAVALPPAARCRLCQLRAPEDHHRRVSPRAARGSGAPARGGGHLTDRRR